VSTIAERYDKLTGLRQNTLDKAVTSERLVTYIGASEHPDDDEAEIWATEPRSAFGDAVSVMSKTMIPGSSVPWMELEAAEDVPMGVPKQLEEAILAEAERQTRAWLQNRNYTTAIDVILRDALIGGFSTVHVGDDRIRVWPVRSAVLERRNGKLHRLITRESSYADLDEDVTSFDDHHREHSDDIYTEVLYEEGEVWQQQGEGGRSLVNGESPEYWFVTTGRVDHDQHYTDSYAHFLRPLISEVHQLREQLVGAVCAAGKTIATIDTELTHVTPQQLADAPNWAVLAARKDAIGYAHSGHKIGDWRFVAEYLAERVHTLRMACLGGLRNRADAIKTATEARLVAAEIDATIEGLYSRYVESLLLPLAKAALRRMGANTSIIQPKIIVGSDALTRQQTAVTLVNVLQTALELFPDLKENVDSLRVLRTLLLAHNIPTEGIITLAQGGTIPEAQMAMQAGGPGGAMQDPRQLLAVIEGMKQLAAVGQAQAGGQGTVAPAPPSNPNVAGRIAPAA
jgi:hypothetical protein